MEDVVIHALEVVHRIVAARLMPVTASAAIHLALVGALLMLPAWTASRESVFFLDLIETETPAASVAPPPPIKRDPRPLRLPKPIASPLPTPAPIDKPTPSEQPIEPPSPRVETPPDPTPTATLPATPMPAGPTPAAPAPSVSAASPSSPAGSSSTFTIAEAPTSSTAAAPAGPAISSLPPDGITQRAIPRGGYQYRPSYPASARNRGIQGTTLLGVLVADDGRVAEVVVKESAGHPDLDKAAADAVRRWRFEPARRGHEAVAMWVLLPVEFRLR